MPDPTLHIDDGLSTGMQRIGQAMVTAVIALASVVVAGWIQERIVASTFPVRFTMEISTAIGFLLCGITLCIRGEPARYSVTRYLRIILPALAVVLGMMMLLRDLLRPDVAIADALNAARTGASAAAPPVQMAASTALGLVLIGSSLLFLSAKDPWLRAAAQVPALAVALLAFLALVGHALGITSLIGIASHAEMAVHAAVALLLLAIATLLVNPRAGVMAWITGSDAGGILARRLLPFVVGLPVGVGWLRLDGEKMELYGREFGVGLMVVSTTLSLITVVFWTARVLGRTDHERALASDALRRANEDLEHRVDERTQALLGAIGELRIEVEERKRAEQAARASEQQLRAVLAERKELEARVLLSDRMASIGTLAAGVAHEINNPLTYIIGNAELIDRRLIAMQQDQRDHHPATDIPQHLERLRTKLADVKDGALRVRDIVTKLRYLTRADEDERRLVDLREVADSAISIAWHEMKHRARLIKEYREVMPVLGNGVRFGQVLVNMLVNAAHAIAEGHADRNEIRVTIGIRAPGQVAVEVRDTGCGISPEIRGRIFDPFFTTKAIGVGTGLGLSICHNIVSAAGGQIEVESEVGHGTTFRVILPAAVAAEAAAEVPAAVTEVASRRGRILVIDDEPKVAAMFERLLERDHDVVVSTSGRDALRRVASAATFDLVLCDLMMPEMTGMELHAELTRIAPALAAKTIFVTGGAFTSGARDFLERTTNPILQKPFDSDQLLALIRDALG